MIVCCGPESSGTHLLHAIVTRYFGRAAVHRSLPHGDEGPEHDGWWTADDFPRGTRFVIIWRRPDVTGLSAIAHGHVDSIGQHRDEWARAIGILASIPDAYWVSYEALMAWPEVQAKNIGRWLGFKPMHQLPQIYNQNAKWLGVLQ